MHLNVDAYYGRGLSKAVLGDTTGALLDYDLTINIDDYHLNAYVNRALIMIEHNRIGDALLDYKSVLDIEQNNLDGLYGVAYLLL